MSGTKGSLDSAVRATIVAHRPAAELDYIHQEDVGALVKLETIKRRFRIWNEGRREESDAKDQRMAELEPARVLQV